MIDPAWSGTRFSGTSGTSTPSVLPVRVDAFYMVSTEGRLSEGSGQGIDVPGKGPSDADTVFVGGLPGRYELMEGEPFMDRSGKVLEEILAFFGMSLDRCYRTLLVKNGVAKELLSRDDIEDWCSMLRGEIEDVEPRAVIVLGSFAVENVIGIDDGVMAVRGTVRYRWDRRMMPTVHPRALAFRPSLRSSLAEDVGTALGPVPAAERTEEVCDV